MRLDILGGTMSRCVALLESTWRVCYIESLDELYIARSMRNGGREGKRFTGFSTE